MIMIKSVSEYFFFVNFIKIYEKINNSSKKIYHTERYYSKLYDFILSYFSQHSPNMLWKNYVQFRF